jgi:YggT family protein
VLTQSFWSLWYFQIPNFLLAAVMYTMLARALLGLFVEHDSKNYIWRGFCSITDPVLRLLAPLTPKATAPVVMWLFGFVWMFWLRVLLLLVLLSLGLLRIQAS